MKEIDRLRAELERRDDELNRLLSCPHASCSHRYGAQGVGQLQVNVEKRALAHSCEMGRCKPGRQISCTTAPRCTVIILRH